ncbi:MAG: hypothetical protein ACHQ51_06155 [Elusimicrobiota bacterium]
MLPALALIAAAFVAGAEPAVSTAAARGRPTMLENPWSLNYGYDRRGKRFGLDYRIRWDANDLADSPRRVSENLSSPSDTAQSIAYGLLKGARFDLYGVSVRPFRELGGETPYDIPRSTAAAAGAPPPPARRLRLALDPLEDLRRNGPREIQRALLREGFNLALPGNRNVPGWQKEAFGRSVLDAGRAWSDDAAVSP